MVISCVHPTTETQELVAVYTLDNQSETTGLSHHELKNFLKVTFAEFSYSFEIFGHRNHTFDPKWQN